MPPSGRVSPRSVAVAVGLLGAIALILALVFGSRPDEDEASAVREPPAVSAPDHAGKRPPSDSGLRMLDANKASVTGTIRDAEGSPIAGATVCAEANQGELLGAGDRLPTCSKSERDGHYRLDGLWPVSTIINAGAPHFIPGRWRERKVGLQLYEIRLHAGEERREIDITLERGGVPVRGVVKDIGGGVVEDALVTSGPPPGVFPDAALAVARSDAEGRFELWAKPGPLSLVANAEGYAPTRTSAGAPTDLATIFLTPESVISGTVVHVETNTPMAGVTVRASGMSGNETITDADGHFRIASLTPGGYELSAEADDLYGESAERVHLGLAQSLEGVVIEVHPAFLVAGKVVIVETGAPCMEGRVTLERDGQQLVGMLDEHGEALVRAVLPGEYKVQVWCADQVSEPEYEPILVADQSLAELEWKVHAGLSIRGVVVDSNAAPVAGVRIYAAPKMTSADPRGHQTSDMSAPTQSDGSFDLGGLLPGSYELDTWSDQHPKLAKSELVTLGEAGLDGVRLVLPATGRLVGIVHYESGAVVPGVTVQVRSLARGRQMPSSTRTGDDGRFEMPQLETGSFRVQARINFASGMRAPGTGDDDLQGEVVEIVANGETQVELIVESRTLSIRGRVVDSTGAPVSDAFVDAARMSDSATVGRASSLQSVRWGWDRKPVLSDHDGNFEIGDLAEGEYVARAYRGGGGEGLLEHVAAGSTGIELTIVDTGQLAGKVVLASGGSPDRFDISVVDLAQGLRHGDDFFRTDGSFVIRELPPGNYKVQATAPAGSAEIEVVLAAGQSIDDLNIELADNITIEGRIVDAETRAPIPGMEVRFSAAGGGFSFMREAREQERVSDADGRFRVEGVKEGKVRVMITPRDSDSPYASTGRDLAVRSEPVVQDIGELELLPRRIKADEKPGDLGYKLAQLSPEIEPEARYFEVAVIRPGGPAENTGLAVGDRIVEVDGQSVAALDSHRYHPLTRAPPGTSILLGIEGGKQVTIVLGQPVE
jgi:protocatechuate 3,4-dioxygenase beta subunit